MNTFVNALNNVVDQKETKTTTTNGMITNTTSDNALLDLFFMVGSARNNPNILNIFRAAYTSNSILATKILLWARDIRNGAGERKVFRDILNDLVVNDPETAAKVCRKIPDLGRWDDLLAINNINFRLEVAYPIIAKALSEGDCLCAKWMPRKKQIANELATYMNLSPRLWRKLVVKLTNVVETKMCAKEWAAIDYSKVPSVASSRYTKAFYRNDTERYSKWRDGLSSGKDVDGNVVKVNASVVYPYDVIRALRNGDVSVANAQWDALPNYMNGNNVLSIVDVSGSMDTTVSGSITALDVALSLGLYTSDKSYGAFKDVFMTFSNEPEFVTVKGTLSHRCEEMNKSHWQSSTNLEAAFRNLLDFAIQNNVARGDMPTTLLILSDMQFNSCVRTPSDSAFQMIRKMYADAEYNMPNVVFWNINSPNGQSPVKFDERGTALISGFSPSVLTSVLKGEMDPMSIMLDVVDVERYNFK